MRYKLFGWCAVVIGLWAFHAQAEMRTWTSATGAEVQARFVGMEGALVVLETEDGKKISIRADALVAEDQARVRELAAAQAGEGEDEGDEAGPARLPALRGGPGNGRYAFYQHQHFDAYVTTQGRLYVQPKVRGTPVGRPIYFAEITLEQFIDGRYRGRPIADYLDVSPAALNPRSLSFTVVTETDERVQYKVDITFDGPAICVTAEVTEPRTPNTRSRMRILSRYPSTYEIPAAMPQAERQAVLAGASLEYRRRGAGREERNFYDSLSLGSPHVDEVTVKGPWGPLTMKIEADNRREGNSARLSNYSGRALHQGYTMVRYISAGQRAGSYCIRFE